MILPELEKFTSSVKDGIDIRDTLRHWHTGDIYVKEIPPSRGQVEIILFLFDPEPEPEKYNWCQTWYAEHDEESTLCFYATQYMDDLIGAGHRPSHLWWLYDDLPSPSYSRYMAGPSHSFL